MSKQYVEASMLTKMKSLHAKVPLRRVIDKSSCCDKVIIRSAFLPQGESLWLHQELMQEMLHTNGKHFRSAEYASVQVPTYPCGQISLFVASVGQDTCTEPAARTTLELLEMGAIAPCTSGKTLR